MRLDESDCIVGAATGLDYATIVLNDCDCEREAAVTAASGYSVEGLPNEKGEANCADVDSVELAKCSRSPVENENASGGCRPGDAMGVRSGGSGGGKSGTRTAEGLKTPSPTWTYSLDGRLPNTRSLHRAMRILPISRTARRESTLSRYASDAVSSPASDRVHNSHASTSNATRAAANMSAIGGLTALMRERR